MDGATNAGVARIVGPPSMSKLASDALRTMILSGELRPGDRVVENRLTVQLGVSRPPLREALKELEYEGLVVQHPRRGAVVTPITQHDVYEIVTMREELETMAVRLGVPVRSPELLRPVADALRALERAAEGGDEAAVTAHGFAFHLAVVGLGGHRRLADAYRALALQMQLCMGLNRRARKDREDLAGNAARHRELLRVIEAGDQDATLAALAAHGHRTFLAEIVDGLGGATPRSREWLRELRENG
ncbi:MAG TPA: GntR family transcriptional regulator [Streptosporangiaceae bacterium]|jgi:DNA-binding GntR family transcriptional regulator